MHYTCPKNNLVEKLSFWKNCFLCSLSDKKQKCFDLLLSFFKRGCQIWSLSIPRNFLKKSFHGKGLCFSPIRNNEQKIFGLEDSFFIRVIKTAICVSGGSFCGEKVSKKIVSFSKTEREISGCLSETFRQVCQRWLLLLHGNNLVKNIFLKFPCLFGQRVKSSRPCGTKFLQIYRKCIPEERFWKKYFFEKNLDLLIILGHWAKFFQPIAETFS